MKSVLNSIALYWGKLFLAERPSVSLGLFRVAVAITVGLHVFPTLLEMPDNYFSGSFREWNLNFFTLSAVQWVAGHSDRAVWAMAAIFTISWFGFLAGFLTQLSGLLMLSGCYYFYARNSMHIGTLSFDIMLVTLSLVVATNYFGDCVSLDSLIRGDPKPWERRRPYFIQRLPQLQVASTFFYTGLCKWTSEGNWLTGNAYYFLLNTPPEGVVKQFPGRGFLMESPQLCWAIGVGVIVFEMTLWFWLLWRRTRLWAILAACFFHVLLLVTLHVPTIFFFLFPPQLLLFIEPEVILSWLNRRRQINEFFGRAKVIFDGHCGFCRSSIARLSALDPTGRLEMADFHSLAGALATSGPAVPLSSASGGLDAVSLHPALTAQACHAQWHLLEDGTRLSGGFAAFQRMTLKLPMLWPLAPIANFPGMVLAGEPVYRWVARNRFLFHRGNFCRDNACG
ncbi:MAG: DUF393 domain-containing protein [Elusimicrobia bacterium]|nr:DUF393 domain-containing protein [Elusimicrobiota bacterium]